MLLEIISLYDNSVKKCPISDGWIKVRLCFWQASPSTIQVYVEGGLPKTCNAGDRAFSKSEFMPVWVRIGTPSRMG